MTAKKTGWLSAGLLCLALWPGAALSQSPALEATRQQFDTFYRQGRYESAIASGQRAHARAVAELGAEHRETLAIQLGLAEAYRAQARFAEAEPLRVVGGQVRIPEVPGTGIAWNEDAIPGFQVEL